MSKRVDLPEYKEALKDIETYLSSEELVQGLTKPAMNLITLQCRIWFDGNEFLDITAILDTGSSKSVLSYHLVPTKFQIKNNYKTLTNS